jgi:hypothetical protein
MKQKYDFKLPSKVKNKWVRALRSGKWKKGSYKLKRSTDGDQTFKYCCLGVAAECSLAHPSHNGDQYVRSEFLPIYIQRDLSELNDYREWSFKRIATYIEKYL